jgi:hypothetical protein
MTPLRSGGRKSGQPPRDLGQAALAVPQPYLRALASALGRGPGQTGRPVVTALRALVLEAAEALQAVAPAAAPPAGHRATREEAPADYRAEPVDRPGLASTRKALERLSAGARSPGLAGLADLYPTPTVLTEDVFLARCLSWSPGPALDLATMRDFLARAVVPERLSELAIDRTVTLDQASFAALWAEPNRLDSIRATFDYFRSRFKAALLAHHAGYWGAMRRLRLSLEESEPTVAALVRLNSLEQLGQPLGQEALAQHGCLLADTQDCPLIEGTEEALATAASCPACNLTLADEPPSAEVDAVSRRLSRALGQQMTRLSSAAIRRILGRARGERIEQFLQVVQASDLAGLASVLDDELLEFLRDLLAAEPSTAMPSVMETLRRACPLVGEGDVEAAAETFRRLLVQALADQRRARPDRPPTVRLDLPAGQAGLPARPRAGADRGGPSTGRPGKP